MLAVVIVGSIDALSFGVLCYISFVVWCVVLGDPFKFGYFQRVSNLSKRSGIPKRFLYHNTLLKYIPIFGR